MSLRLYPGQSDIEEDAKNQPPARIAFGPSLTMCAAHTRCTDSQCANDFVVGWDLCCFFRGFCSELLWFGLFSQRGFAASVQRGTQRPAADRTQFLRPRPPSVWVFCPNKAGKALFQEICHSSKRFKRPWHCQFYVELLRQVCCLPNICLGGCKGYFSQACEWQNLRGSRKFQAQTVDGKCFVPLQPYIATVTS